MDKQFLLELLQQVQAGRLPIDDAYAKLRALPFDNLGYAVVDNHRAIRTGFPEVIYCAGKTPEQAAAIFARLVQHNGRVLATRADRAIYTQIHAAVPEAIFDEDARAVYYLRDTEALRQEQQDASAPVLVVSAGTSDIPVAEEAALTAGLLGCRIDKLFDVGVAGLHRILHRQADLQRAAAIVVAAGMEGALASIVAGLTASPVIAVPTSVGYGASFHGLAALLAMLNTCAPGVAVVNIDNGFGAGFMAGIIARQTTKNEPQPIDTDDANSNR